MEGGQRTGLAPDRLGREDPTEKDVPAKLTSREGYVLPEENLQRGGSEDVPAKLTSREGYVLEGGGNSGIRKEGRAPDLDCPRGEVFLGAIRWKGGGGATGIGRGTWSMSLKKYRDGRGAGGGLTRGIDILSKVLSPAHRTRLLRGEEDRRGEGWETRHCETREEWFRHGGMRQAREAEEYRKRERARENWEAR